LDSKVTAALMCLGHMHYIHNKLVSIVLCQKTCTHTNKQTDRCMQLTVIYTVLHSF